MNLQTKVDRLERQIGTDGKCSACAQAIVPTSTPETDFRVTGSYPYDIKCDVCGRFLYVLTVQVVEGYLVAEAGALN